MRSSTPTRWVPSILLFAFLLVFSATANSESITNGEYEKEPRHDTKAAGIGEGLAAASDLKGKTSTITEISTKVVAATIPTETRSINHQYHRHGTGPELLRARGVTTNISTATTTNAAALACYKTYSKWRQGSMSWYSTAISGRSTSLKTTTSTITQVLQTVNTIYPSKSLSTYKLCDGSPRVDFEPLTLTSTYTSFSPYEAYVTVGLPVYSVPHPREATPDECLYLYYGSGISWDDVTLMALCGSPAHLGQVSCSLKHARLLILLTILQPCLIMGGPVELAYFPVTTAGSNKCHANGSTITNTGGPTVIEALGTTLTSGNVYLSFKTLYAFQDGFDNRIGPTYTDFIMPFPSSAISTQCGGWQSAQGPGTPLNYADLNFPWPASAYNCMNRCSTDVSTTYINGTDAPYKPPSQCSTIWSDLNPILAMPTEVRDMVPEWSSCSMWDEALPNFVFDPPRALVAGTAVATPTVPWKGPATTATASPAETSYTALPETMATTPATTPTSSSSTSTIPSPSSSSASTWIPSAAPRPSRGIGHTAINIEFNIDSHTFTASAGDNAFSISGQTISVGGPAQVVEGETISLALGGFVVNATTTIPFTSTHSGVTTSAGTQASGTQVSMQQSTTAGKKTSSSAGSRIAISWAGIALGSLVAMVYL